MSRNQKNPKFPPENVLNAENVFKHIGLKAKQRGFFEKAVNMLNVAEAVTKNDNDKVPICIYKSEVQNALNNMDESKYEALKAISFDTSGRVLPYLNMANLLYDKNEYGAAIKYFSKGLNTNNKDFKRGIDMALGTLSQSIGDDAGRMFDDKLLGNVVRKMKLESCKGNLLECKMLSHDEEVIREKLLKQRKRYIAGRYLGRLSEDKRFFEDLYNNKKLTFSNKINEDNFRDIVENGLKKLELIEESKWQRKPLYSYYNQIATSDHAKTIEKTKDKEKLLYRQTLKTNIINRINRLDNFKLAKKYKQCFDYTLQLRSELKTIKIIDFPIKRDCSLRIYEIMGDLYLSSKCLMTNMSEKFNDLRIKFQLSVFKDRWPTHIEEVHHIFVLNSAKLVSQFSNDLIYSTDECERAYLNAELACILGMQAGKGARTRSYAFQSLISAKKAGSLVWYLNSLFLIARSEFSDDNFEEGVLTLVAAKIACKQYGRLSEVAFIERALLLLQHLKPDDFKVKPILSTTEKTIMNMMPTKHLKDKAAANLITLKDIPVWRRMQLSGRGTQKQMKAAQRDTSVSGYDDRTPYHVPDIMSQADKEKLEYTVYNTPRYAQFLTLSGKAKDYDKRKRP